MGRKENLDKPTSTFMNNVIASVIKDSLDSL